MPGDQQCQYKWGWLQGSVDAGILWSWDTGFPCPPRVSSGSCGTGRRCPKKDMRVVSTHLCMCATLAPAVMLPASLMEDRSGKGFLSP